MVNCRCCPQALIGTTVMGSSWCRCRRGMPGRIVGVLCEKVGGGDASMDNAISYNTAHRCSLVVVVVSGCRHG